MAGKKRRQISSLQESGAGQRFATVNLNQPMASAIAHLEEAMLRHALMNSHGRLEEAAVRLGISRKGLFLKRKKLGIIEREAK